MALSCVRCYPSYIPLLAKILPLQMFRLFTYMPIYAAASAALDSAITSNENTYSLMSSVESNLLPGMYSAAASRTLCGAGGFVLDRTCSADPLFRLTFSNSCKRSSMAPLSWTWSNRTPSAAPSSMACPPPWPWTVPGVRMQSLISSDLYYEGNGLTGEHGMGCVADQEKSVLVPLGNWPSGDQFPKLHVFRFSVSL